MKSIFCTNKEILEKIKELDPYQNPKYKMTDDLSSGALFADVFGDIVKYNVTAKSFYIFDGTIWKEDKGEMIADSLAKRFSRAWYIYAADSDQVYQKYVLSFGSRRRRVTMTQDAKSYNCISGEMLDAKDNLLNLQNGVLNLETLEFEPHKPEYLLSKMCNVEYKPEAKSKDFEKFISEIMLGDREKIEYIQRIFGYSLTAQNAEETAFLFYGKSTRNGKSSLLETFAYMLGTYSANAQPETLAQRKKDPRNASGDICRLQGCRFLHISEPPKRMLLDTALLKTLTGRDKITARNLYERETEFYPVFKLAINTNYLPQILDDSVFSSGRLQVLSFEKHFEPEEQDRTLKDRLKEPHNLSGLLNWSLQGLRMFREKGIEPPQTVKDATTQYREESDKIKQFFADDMLEDDGHVLEAQKVYTHYIEWCRSNGYGCETRKNFYDELRAKNLLWRTATKDGRTIRNAVKGYRIGINENLPPDKDFVKTTPEEQAELPFND